MDIIKVALENIKDLTTEQLLDSLPPRYINFPFDDLLELQIKRVNWKGRLEWRVGYYSEKSINQETDLSLRKAVIALITRMLEKSYNIEFTIVK